MAANMTLQDAAGATGDGTPYELGAMDAALAVQVSGTFVGTVTFEATVDGTNWIAVQVRNLETDDLVSTATAPGLFVCPVAGLLKFRARVSAWTSGEITARARASSGTPRW